jgi:rhodanese-related sulfurtransferase
MATTITRAEVQVGVNDGTLVLVDALGGGYYEQQHLPGALPLVAADVDALAPTLLPDRDAAIVTYCSNTACPNSGQVADRLMRLGYTNVRKYAEGIQDWVEAGLPVESGVFAGV